MVHDSAKAVASRKMGSPRRISAVILFVVAGAIAGCGGGSSTQPQVDVGPNVGQPISLADCNDWKQADTAQRLGTIQQLRDFAGGPVVGNNAASPAGRGSVLDDKKAYDLFNGWCSQSYARGFKLYKLYERAAAFSGAPQQ